jgi:hypothetical protein
MNREPAALTRRQHSTKHRLPVWPEPLKRRDKPKAGANRRLAEQTRKILRKHYMSKYRVQ